MILFTYFTYVRKPLLLLGVTLSSILLILERSRSLPRPLGSYSGCVISKITESDEYTEISTSLLMQDVNFKFMNEHLDRTSLIDSQHYVT